tara:strand:- start:819 stop:1049 length:231 start_codon:yes stop_codon:yes gene_type:complete
LSPELVLELPGDAGAAELIELEALALAVDDELDDSGATLGLLPPPELPQAVNVRQSSRAKILRSKIAMGSFSIYYM